MRASHLAHIERVVKSCRTQEQLQLAWSWARKITTIDELLQIMDSIDSGVR